MEFLEETCYVLSLGYVPTTTSDVVIMLNIALFVTEAI